MTTVRKTSSTVSSVPPCSVTTRSVVTRPATAPSVRGLTADAVRSFYAERYVTENTVVAVAGAVDPDEVIDQVTKAFDGLPVGRAPVDRQAPPIEAMTPGSVVTIDDDTEQVHLVVGGRALHRLDPDRDALDVANHVLGGGLSSRLFDEIRERRGLAYSVFSTAAAYADSGAWSVYAGTMPEHAAEVRELIGTEIDRLVADGITAEELEIAQGYLAGSYEMGLEDSGARMSRLGGQLTILGHLRSVEEQLDRWAAVSVDDVRSVDRTGLRLGGARDGDGRPVLRRWRTPHLRYGRRGDDSSRCQRCVWSDGCGGLRRGRGRRRTDVGRGGGRRCCRHDGRSGDRRSRVACVRRRRL